MTRNEFTRLVSAALERIPDEFRMAMQNVQVVLEDWPDPSLMEDVTGDPDDVLYGLYTGTPLPDRAADYGNTTPDVITLYQGPLEEDFPDREELIYEIEVTLVHEIAHYFGFDEETIERYGYD
ncbi:MAG: metallopeptidase family protein [Nitrospirota bacterium]